MPNKEYQNLHINIAYEDYINADQLSAILSALDRLYSYLYISYAHDELEIPLPLETRMRIEKCRTGNSILLELAEGIRQVVSGSTIEIMETIGIPVVMTRLIIGFAKGFAEFRKTWYEGSQAKYEAEKAKHEAERLRSDLEKEECAKKISEGFPDLPIIPDPERQRITEVTIQLLTLLEYAPNIKKVQINGAVILDKRRNMKD